MDHLISGGGGGLGCFPMTSFFSFCTTSYFNLLGQIDLPITLETTHYLFTIECYKEYF